MKLLQRPPIVDRTDSLLSVNADTFAELTGIIGDNYSFNFNFKILLTSTRKDPKDYDKVVITVKKKESEKLAAASRSSNVVTALSGLKDNSGAIASTGPSLVKSLKPDNGIPAPKMSDKVANKLLSGLNILKDLEIKEMFIEQVSVSIAALLEDASKNLFTVTELYAPAYKPLRGIARQLNNDIREGTHVFPYRPTLLSHDTSRVDPTDTIERINRELCDITEPVSSHHLKTLTSESHIDDPKLRLTKSVVFGKAPLSFDIVKYYLNDVPKSPQEDSMQWYEKRQVTKHLEDIEVNHLVKINKINKNLNLTVRFDLYKRGINKVDESVTVDFFMPSHIEAFNCIVNPPDLQVSQFTRVLGKMIKGAKSHSLTIHDKESKGKIASFNVYMKDVSSLGTVSGYRKLTSVRNTGTSQCNFTTQSDLSVVRVVPVDFYGKESNVFTNIVVGPGHKVIGALTILPSHYAKNEVRVDVFNVPKDAASLTLYRRDCTDNPDDSFTSISVIKGHQENTNAVFFDDAVEIGRTYEYYVMSLTLSKSTKEEIPMVSNFVMFKNIQGNASEKSISVTLTEPNTTQAKSGYVNVSFNIDTQISKTENQRITEAVKQHLGEIYEQYLNPGANASSPLGEGTDGVPQYKDLFFHEVVRTNLNTGERETFELVPDGLFEDKQETQNTYNIKPLNPMFAYRYHVFTFKKNPIELFKKYVAKGIDSRGKEWFYLPYKWKNAAAKVGKLYPDDKAGIPVIDAYESFTSEAFGLTASTKIDGSAQYASLTQILANRVDRNTVKISWSFSGVSEFNKMNLYDSFVVMKVVNGVRGFVGRTFKNYIYHELSEEDLGSVYYIVVPIMAEFDIDEPGYSSPILITPDGLTTRLKSVKLDLGVDAKKKIAASALGKETPAMIQAVIDEQKFSVKSTGTATTEKTVSQTPPSVRFRR